MDCLHHAMGSNISVAQEVLYAAHTGELPPAEADELPRDLEQLIAQHDQAMESCAIHVQDADPSAFLTVTWEHPMFGELNWREWFLFMRIHSKDHARQLQAMTESWRA